ncbi:MAG: carboxypeptidase regulatory-like domain-containing protein [Acidobacteriaceae bacterium]
MKRICIVVLCSLSASIFLNLPETARAQSTVTGAVAGVVEDTSGAVIPGAAVTVTNRETGDKLHTKTGASGAYQFTILQPAQYDVMATAPTFATVTQAAVVNVGQTTTVNFRLAVGSNVQTVSVTTLPQTLQTTNANLSTTLEPEQLQQVPVPGNDVNAILQMAPGAVMTGDLFPSMYGMTTNSNLLISNGMEDIDPAGNSTNGGSSNLLLGLNEVQEVTISATAYTGQFGYLAGSNDTIVTKSGSNAFHGNAKYFWNGRVLNANDYFNNQSDTSRPFVNANQWAASVGGPIVRDKLFFFADTEGVRILLPTSQLALIPSQQFEAATIENLTAKGLSSSIPFYCQGLTLTDASGHAVTCPGGASGIGNGIFNLYNTSLGASRAVPGNGSDPLGCNGFTGLGAGVPCALNYRSTAGNFNPEWIITSRVDWNANASNHVFGHFKYDNGTQASYTDPINPIFNALSPQSVEEGQLSWTSTLSPSLVNEFDTSVEHFHITFEPPNFPASLAAFPTQMVLGDGTFTTLGGLDSVWPVLLNLTDYHFSDNLSKVIHTHSLKFGFDFSRYDLGNGYYTNTNGQLVANTADAFFNGGIDQTSVNAGGTDYSTLTQAYATNKEEPIAQAHMGFFAQDEWKAKDTLTLTFSLRLDHATNPVCQKDCFARTVEPFAQLSHSASIPYNQAMATGLHQGLYNLQGLEWQPRIGFAWQPLGIDKATVVRGGIGLFYDNVPINVAFNQAENVPLNNTFVASSGPLAPTQAGNLFSQVANDNTAFSAGYSQGYTLAQFQAAVPGFSPPQLQESAAQMPEPLVTKWSLEVERGLWKNAVTTVGYVGNHSIHGWAQNGSANAFASGFAGLPATAPDPRFGAVTIMEDNLVSSYNGATVQFADRFGSSIVQANYTYSHSLTDGIGTSNPRYIENPYNAKASYGNSNFDVRNGFTGNYVWTVPFARFIPRAKMLTDGWQLSETVYLHSGYPFTVYDSATDAALAGQNYASSYGGPAYGVLANFNGGKVPSCNNPTAACLNASEFSSASTGFGNQALNQFRGPKFVESDLGFMKMTTLPGKENMKFGVGVQAYNVFNHPNFAVPDFNLADSTFGRILSGVGSPSSIYGVGLGGDNSPRLLQIKGVFEF